MLVHIFLGNSTLQIPAMVNAAAFFTLISGVIKEAKILFLICSLIFSSKLYIQ